MAECSKLMVQGEFAENAGAVRIVVTGLSGDTEAISELLMAACSDALIKHFGDAITGAERVWRAPSTGTKQ